MTTRASPCRRPRQSLAAGSMGSSSQEPLGFSQAAGRTSSSSLSSGRDRRREGKLKMKATIESLQLELNAQTALVAQLGADLEHCRYKLALSIQREAAISAASDAAVAATIRLRFDASYAGIIADAVQRALHNLAAADSYKLISISPGAEAVASAADDVGDSGLMTFPGSEAVASEADDLGASGHGGTVVPFFDAKLDKGEPLPKTDTPPECFAIFDAIADEAVSVLPYEDMPASGPDTAAGCGTATKPDEPSLATSRTGVGSSLTTLDDTTGVAGLGHEVDRVIATSLSVSLTRNCTKKSSYSDGAPQLGYGVSQRLHPEAFAKHGYSTGDAVTQSGPLPIAAASVFHCNVAEDATPSAELHDFKSQHLATQCVNASPRASDAISRESPCAFNTSPSASDATPGTCDESEAACETSQGVQCDAAATLAVLAKQRRDALLGAELTNMIQEMPNTAEWAAMSTAQKQQLLLDRTKEITAKYPVP